MVALHQILIANVEYKFRNFLEKPVNIVKKSGTERKINHATQRVGSLLKLYQQRVGRWMLHRQSAETTLGHWINIQ